MAPASPRSGETLPWTSDDVAKARAECIALLAPILADVEPAPPLKEGACGTPSPVILRSLGRTATVQIRPPATLTCQAVAALYDWLEDTVQPAARSHLGTFVASLSGTSGYQCRNRVGGGETKISEHAKANAIDITAMTTHDGRLIDVKTEWGSYVEYDRGASGPGEGALGGATPPTEQGGPLSRPPLRLSGKGSPPPRLGPEHRQAGSTFDFLRSLHIGACKRFGTVLGPEANSEHKNHLHLDMAYRRSTSYCR